MVGSPVIEEPECRERGGSGFGGVDHEVLVQYVKTGDDFDVRVAAVREIRNRRSNRLRFGLKLLLFRNQFYGFRTHNSSELPGTMRFTVPRSLLVPTSSNTI